MSRTPVGTVTSAAKMYWRPTVSPVTVVVTSTAEPGVLVMASDLVPAVTPVVPWATDPAPPVTAQSATEVSTDCWLAVSRLAPCSEGTRSHISAEYQVAGTRPVTCWVCADGWEASAVKVACTVLVPDTGGRVTGCVITAVPQAVLTGSLCQAATPYSPLGLGIRFRPASP